MSDSKEIREDADYSFEAVPAHARKPFRSIFFIMLGFTFFSGSMSVGARLGNGLDFSRFAASVVIGGLFLSAYAGLLAYIGSETGLSFDLLARRAFIRKHTPQRTIAAIETFFNRFLTSQFKRSAMPDSPDVTGMSLASFDIPSDVCANVWKSSIENLKSAIKLN